MTSIIETAKLEAQAKYDVLRSCDIESLYVHLASQGTFVRPDMLSNRTNMVLDNNGNHVYAIEKYVYIRSILETFFENFNVEPIIVFYSRLMTNPTYYTHRMLMIRIGMDIGASFISPTGNPVSYRTLRAELKKPQPRGGYDTPNPFEEITFDLDNLPKLNDVISAYNIMAHITRTKFKKWSDIKGTPYDMTTSKFAKIEDLAEANFNYARTEIIAMMPSTYNLNDATLRQLFSVVIDNPENVEFEPDWEQRLFDHLK